jgi:hypothetical protein
MCVGMSDDKSLTMIGSSFGRLFLTGVASTLERTRNILGDNELQKGMIK